MASRGTGSKSFNPSDVVDETVRAQKIRIRFDEYARQYGTDAEEKKDKYIRNAC